MTTINKIVFISEVSGRDIIGRCYISQLLAERYGVDCYLLEQEMARNLPYTFWKSTIIIDKAASKNRGREKFYKKIKKNKNVIIMVEDEEQQSILTNRNTFVSFRISNETLKKIDRYLCWNSKILMTIKANFSNFSDLFYLSGSSRYTFYKEHSWELEKNHIFY